MYQYNGKMIDVIDGDTFEVEVDLGFHIKHRIRVRLKAINTAEIYRPVNDFELEHARAAKAFVEDIVSKNDDVVIQTYKERGSSFGRFVADIYVHVEEGKVTSLKELLENANMAKLESYDKPYTEA